jgi:hypothetical protein
MNNEPDARWLLLVYRVPAEPSAGRVAVWRDLKKIGALYLQQCVCVVPRTPPLEEALAPVRARIDAAGGSSNLFAVSGTAERDDAALLAGFRELVAKQYAEIVEECETKFVKEIEFEYFRENFSYAEAEEIEQDLEKIRRWYAQVRSRDWFDAPGRDTVEGWIARCAELLDGFYATVHQHAEGDTADPDAADRDLASPAPLAPVPAKRRAARPRGKRPVESPRQQRA